MQKKAPLTPRSRRTNRMMSRSTMAPGDFLNAGPSGNHRPPLSRQSIMPGAQSILDTSRKLESESKDAEMKYLYNAYLQTEAMVLLMKKKAKESEKTTISQLATLMKEEDAIKKELMSVETRERELKSFIKLQNDLDEQLANIMACLADFDEKPVEMLNQLRSILEFLDVLKCDNVIIPKTSDEMKRFLEQLKSCESLLITINEIIGSKRDALITVNKGLRDFNKTYVDIQDFSEKCREALQQLQIAVLHKGADLLSLARSDDHVA